MWGPELSWKLKNWSSSELLLTRTTEGQIIFLELNDLQNPARVVHKFWSVLYKTIHCPWTPLGGGLTALPNPQLLGLASLVRLAALELLAALVRLASLKLLNAPVNFGPATPSEQVP